MGDYEDTYRPMTLCAWMTVDYTALPRLHNKTAGMALQ